LHNYLHNRLENYKNYNNYSLYSSTRWGYVMQQKEGIVGYIYGDVGSTEFNFIGAVGKILCLRDRKEFRPEHTIKTAIGAAVTPDVYKIFTEEFNIPNVIDAYGLSEIPAVCQNPIGGKVKIGSMGLPSKLPDPSIPFTEMKVVDDNRQELPVGEIGEIIARNPVQMREYYKEPDKTGETIIDELYSFTDKGGRDLALRPELTAPVIRFYVDKLQMEPKPLKLYYFGNCYRYDRPQKGRYREFKQAGCEIIGTDTPEAYAELIAMAYKLIENAGVKNLKLNIGNLNILSAIFNQLKISEDRQKYITPLIDKSMFEDVFSALRDFGINSEDANALIEILQTTDIKVIRKFLKDDDAKKELKNLEYILKLLENSFDIKNYQIQMSIVRGLDYYKGIVFEIKIKGDSEQEKDNRISFSDLPEMSNALSQLKAKIYPLKSIDRPGLKFVISD